VLRVFLSLRNQSASTFPEQLVLVSAVLGLDRAAEGAIAEFGCYKGASSAVLSIAARAVGRKLVVFDSFDGLPTPTEDVRNAVSGEVIAYKRGMYAGSLSQVRSNVEMHGEIQDVEFVKGYFSDTLPHRAVDEKFALIFEDADLVSSVKDVLIHAWPRLNVNGLFFCHEAQDLEVHEVFFDAEFWATHHGCRPPGLIGVGTGLPVNRGGFGEARIGPIPGRYGSSLAYVIKTGARSGAALTP
jgi:O-methyltransferase